jgi:hypothetical protein
LRKFRKASKLEGTRGQDNGFKPFKSYLLHRTNALGIFPGKISINVVVRIITPRKMALSSSIAQFCPNPVTLHYKKK